MGQSKLVLHHIGIATEDIADMTAQMENRFDIVKKTEIVYDPIQKASLCMLTLKDGVQIELVQGEAVAGFLRRNQRLYHTCYQTDNIDEMVKKLVEEGGTQVTAPESAVLFGGRRVCFLMTQLGLIELVEEER